MIGSDKSAAGALEFASEAEMEREEARRHLLSSFGLVPLISRYDPVGARPANRLAVPVVDAGSEGRGLGAALEGNTISHSEGEMQGDQLRALLRHDSGVTRSPASDGRDTDHSDRPAVTPNRSEQRLSLLIVVTGDVLWIEQLQDQLLRKEQLHLIAAMGRAIRGPSVNCEHQKFDWPPDGAFKLTQADGLQEMLSGLLQRMATDHQSQLVIELGSIDVLPPLDLAVHCIPSSLAMLQDPSTKRTAWSILKSLVASR
jgi:hypothetical protein